MAEAVKVIVRCRPLNRREKDLNCKTAVKMDGKVGQCTITNLCDPKNQVPKSFTFDGAYFTDSTTEQIYADVGYSLVESVTEGYNGTIFAYGQTGCGKSFSMQGITDPATQRGIIPRAFDHIFETISVSEGQKYLVHASYLEIYNEDVRDLLGKDAKSKLDLKEHPEKGIYVQGLSMHTVHNVSDCNTVMDRGWKNRSVGATLMNADSSRSHSIFTINIEMATTLENGEEKIKAGKLNLVDLAGSERQGKTGATGDRLKEATKINLSLSALGNVISALVDGKSKHIPYRDSKLTRLLQDSLGGNTKTLMVACLSPADNNYDETLSTLRYANRAKNIKNKPKVNEDPKDALLREYQEEIQKLKAMLMGQVPIPEGGFDVPAQPAQKGAKPVAAIAPVAAGSEVVEKVVHVHDEGALAAEKERIREVTQEKQRQLKMEYEDQLNDMKRLYEEEKIGKAKLAEEHAKLREFYDSKLSSLDVQEGITSPMQDGVAVAGVASVATTAQDGGSGEVTHTDMAQQSSPRTADTSQSQVTLHTAAVGTEVGTEIEPGRIGAVSVTSVESGSPTAIVGAQQAVHIETTHAAQQHEGEEGVLAPRASPTGEQTTVNLEHQEALRRLEQLQAQMVGGEQKDNTEVKERRKKKKQHVEVRKRKLADAVKKMEDDGIMLNVYDDINQELKVKNELIEKERQKVTALDREIIDLQSEFEFDRIDYLATIRRQEQENKLMQAIIDKIHPCLRRDCNYSNLDRIKS
ncbi:unnamed protein product, partial [Owenia fusiformis]